MKVNTINESLYKKITIALSVVIPVVVALLFGVKLEAGPFMFLPPIYATINGLTAILLIASIMAIKRGNVVLHEKLVTVCLGLSLVFLGLYVTYHMTSNSTAFGGEGFIRPVYYFILISHILLSIIVIPLVMFSWLKAKLSDFKAHKKIVKFAFPIWLYVAVTGVVVYLMISPYYSA